MDFFKILSGRRIPRFMAIILFSGLASAVLVNAQGLSGGWTINSFLYKPPLGARGTEQKQLFDNGLDRVDRRLGQTILVTDPSFGAKGDGIADDTVAIQNAVNAVHNSGGGGVVFPKGAYKTTDNIIIPSDVSAEGTLGAVINIAAGKTLTVNGPIKAGLWQIFTGAGTVAGDPKVPHILPQWFGAAGDNSTDDAAAINAAANLARTATCKRIKLPGCTGYKATAQLDLRQLNIEGDGLITTSYAGAGVLIGNGVQYDIKLSVNRIFQNWTAGNIGIKATDIRASHLTLGANYHEIGIKFEAGTAGTAYNTINLKYVNSNKIGLMVHVPSGSTGWCNENLVLGGDFGNSTAGGECAVKLLCEGTNIIDKWTFVKPAIEYGNTDATAGFIFSKAQTCQVHDARWECGFKKIAQFLNSSFDNVITLGSIQSSNTPFDWDEAPEASDSYGNDVRMSNDLTLHRLNDITSFAHAYHDGTYTHVPGFQIFGLASSTGQTFRKLSTTGSINLKNGPGGAYLSIDTAVYGVGITVNLRDTNPAKKLYVKMKRPLSGGYTPGICVVCFDVNGNILSGSSPYYVKGRKCAAVGQYYRIQTTKLQPLIFHADAARAHIGVAAPYNPDSRATGFEVYSPYLTDGYLEYTGPKEVPGSLFAANAPTKWPFHRGESVKNEGAAVGATPGWVCVRRVDTTVKTQAVAGDDHVHVNSITGIASGDVIYILLDSGEYHSTTVNGAPSGDTVTLTNTIPTGKAAAIGNAVIANLWAAMANL